MKFQINYRKDEKTESFIVEAESISKCKDMMLDEMFKRGVSPKGVWSNELSQEKPVYSEEEKKITEYEVEIEK